MTTLFALRTLLFGGECFAASVLLLGIAAIGVRFIKSASLRHLVWLTAFGTMLVLPLAAFVVPPQIAIHQRVHGERAVARPALISTASPHPMLPPAQKPMWNIGPKDVMLAALALWLIGLGWNALRLIIAVIGVNALSMSSKRMAGETPRYAVDLHGCDLRLASDRSGPMTWGTLRPVILLPNEASGWPPERLRAVLLHEAAHVQRRDSFAQTISRIACALYWPNPLAWIGARAMRRDAEIAADDAVIGAGVLPSAYAAELLTLAAEHRGAWQFAGAGLAMAAESRLEARVKSILGSNRSRKGVTHMDIVKIAGTGLLAAAAFAFVRPSLANDAPVPRKPVHLTTLNTLPALPKAPVRVAENDRPPVPSTPATPPLPPEPPVPDAPALAQVPPVPVEPGDDEAINIDSNGEPEIIIERSVNGHRVVVRRQLTPQEREKVRVAIRKAREQVHAAMEKARPEMRRAMAEIERAGPEIARARAEMRRQRPQIERAMAEMKDLEPSIDEAMAKARANIAKAHIDAHVQARVEAAMKRAEERLRLAQVRMEHRREMRKAGFSDRSDEDHDFDTAGDGDRNGSDSDTLEGPDR